MASRPAGQVDGTDRQTDRQLFCYRATVHRSVVGAAAPERDVASEQSKPLCALEVSERQRGHSCASCFQGDLLDGGVVNDFLASMWHHGMDASTQAVVAVYSLLQVVLLVYAIRIKTVVCVPYALSGTPPPQNPPTHTLLAGNGCL
jgi:hypothetical protein